MNDHEPDNRAGWSFLGFMRSVLRDGPSFWRLFALVLLLIFGYALAKGDVTALYEHLTLHATVWEKWGIPPGGVSIFFGSWKYFSYQKSENLGKLKETGGGGGRAAEVGGRRAEGANGKRGDGQVRSGEGAPTRTTTWSANRAATTASTAVAPTQTSVLAPPAMSDEVHAPITLAPIPADTPKPTRPSRLPERMPDHVHMIIAISHVVQRKTQS